MKTFKFLALAFAAIAFVACSDDKLPEGIDEGKGNTDEGEAWIALNLKTSGNTRALNDPDKENGTAAESTVSSVRVIFFDKNKRVVSDATLPTVNVGIPGQPVGIGGSAFKVSAAAKHILVIANPPTNTNAFPTTAFSSDTPYADVALAIKTATVANLTTENGFMMINAKGGLEPSLMTAQEVTDSITANSTRYPEATTKIGDLKDLKLHKTASAAEASALEINIERVVAKVRVGATLTNSQTNPAKDPYAEGLGWVLNVTNKKYIPLPARTKTWMEDNTLHSKLANNNKDLPTAGNPGASRNTLISPFDAYKLGSYRKDPNFDNTNLWDTTKDPDENSQANYAAEYNYSYSGSTIASWNTLGLDADAEYCLENTQAAMANKHAYTTQVLFKAAFAPYSFVKYELDNGAWKQTTVANTAAKVDWLKIGTTAHTFETLLTWIEREIKEKYAATDPDNYDAVRTKAINEYLTSINANAAAMLPLPTVADGTFGPSAPTYKTAADVWKAVQDAYGTNNTTDNTARKAIYDAGSVEYKSISFYKGGVNYYKIMIKHDNNDHVAALNQLGEFGVVRNSVYDVKVTKIMNAGSPIIPDPTPEKWDEDDDDWLAVQININPWTWYTQSVEL